MVPLVIFFKSKEGRAASNSDIGEFYSSTVSRSNDFENINNSKLKIKGVWTSGRQSH